jgi:hypothetical protein
MCKVVHVREKREGERREALPSLFSSSVQVEIK